MPTFGFSAFLKLISLSARRQRSVIRDRLLRNGGGYDFHRSLKLLSRRLLVDGEPFADVWNSTSNIVQAPEQRSARSGLQSLQAWKNSNALDIVDFPTVLYESKKSIFKVKYTPDFGLAKPFPTAIHIWNTAFPELNSREIYGALSLILPCYDGSNRQPADIALLSLRNSELYRLSAAPDFSLIGSRISSAIENVIMDVRDEIENGTPKSPDLPLYF